MFKEKNNFISSVARRKSPPRERRGSAITNEESSSLRAGGGFNFLVLLGSAAILLIIVSSVGLFWLKKESSTETPPELNGESVLLTETQATLSLLTNENEAEIRFQTPLEGIMALSIKLVADDGQVLQITPSEELKKLGWQFPVKKISQDGLELALIYLETKGYSFEDEITLATLTFKQGSTFTFDPVLTKVTTKDGQVLTPNFENESYAILERE